MAEQMRSPLTSEFWKAYEKSIGPLCIVDVFTSDSVLSDGQGKVELVLNGEFCLPADINEEIRCPQAQIWSSHGAFDGANVGVSAISRGRHALGMLRLDLHTYRWFDFLATHRSVRQGHAKNILDKDLNQANKFEPVSGFPNPLGVGLTFFCDSGCTLVLGVRQSAQHEVVGWYSGRLANAVGENAIPEDFWCDTERGKLISTPQAIARRGIREELGLSAQEADDCEIEIAGLFWASDILDFKFFGFAFSTLTKEELLARWRSASDSDAMSLYFIDVSSTTAAEEYWASEKEKRLHWSPELRVCLSSALLIRSMVSAEMLL